jgi:predicted esterase
MEFENIQFESNLSRFPVLESFPSNKVFDLRLWRPINLEDQKNSEVIILINGFMEGVRINNSTPSRKLYESIASELNKNNISAIHYPLPFHFERSGESNPVERLKINGSFLYYGGFSQVIEDIEKLIKEILEDPSKYGLEKNPKIHLLGYSLGGIAAVGAAAELVSKNIGFKFSSLSVLLSAWNFNNISPRNISVAFRNTITSEDWEKVMKDLEQIRDDSSFSQVFKYLIWETGEPIQFSKLADKVLFLHGHNDEIFNMEDTRRIQRLLLDEMNQCTLINLPCKHAIHFDRNIVARYVANFITSEFSKR